MGGGGSSRPEDFGNRCRYSQIKHSHAGDPWHLKGWNMGTLDDAGGTLEDSGRNGGINLNNSASAGGGAGGKGCLGSLHSAGQ